MRWSGSGDLRKSDSIQGITVLLVMAGPEMGELSWFGSPSRVPALGWL